MEELMSEAAEQILSSERTSSLTALSQPLRRNSSDIPQASCTDVNSVALLRLSITSSIKGRYSKAQMLDESETKQTKSNRCDEQFTKRPNIDVQMLNTKLVPLTPKSSDLSNKSDNLNAVFQQADEGHIPKKAFSRQVSEIEVSDPEESPISSLKGTKIDEDIKTVETKLEEEVVTCRKTVENGIKLARRQSADNIFENCSTYNLACSQVVFENKSKAESQLESNSSIHDESSVAGSHFAVGGNEIFTNSMFTEDQISLGDSFFASMNSDEFSSNTSSFSTESVNSSMGQKSVNGSYSADSDVSEYADVSYHKQNGVHMNRSREHKLNKKLRKRQKKSKSKDVSKYTCPKCGVSYILSSNVSARCLHCDFWTSVEPEFLKPGKYAWKTCRVC